MQYSLKFMVPTRLLHLKRSRSRSRPSAISSATVRDLAARLSRPSLAAGPALSGRGHGECRALAAPMARLQQKMQAAGTTGSAETSRHSPRDGLTAASRSPRCAGLSGHRIATTLARRAGYQRRDIRTTRLDRAHRCCSSAWKTTLQHRHAHRIPPQRPWSAPLIETGRGETIMIS